MIVVHTVADLREALAPSRIDRRTVGLVPTMGALHHGHEQLLLTAAHENDVVVLSVFVNPAQFDDPADLAAYPRTDEKDRAVAEAAGVTIYFAPQPQEVYPPGFSAGVVLDGPIVENFEGAHRGVQHFYGVATVVTKLLLMARPDRVYFGQKDAQQLRVVHALVDDLNIDVQIVPVATVREHDGLAMSSRNVRLGGPARAQAVGLSRALFAGQEAFREGERVASSILHRSGAILDEYRIVPEYLAIVEQETFLPVEIVPSSGAIVVVAATIGGIRLIDNVVLDGRHADTHSPGTGF